MTYPFVEAGSYRTGRARAIRLICLHATQSPCAGYAPRIANYFAGGPGVSSHYVCDDTQTIQCVADEDTAFTAPNANADGLHIEQCGYSEWSRTEWLTGPPARMLETQVAPLVAHLAAKHGIPLRWLTPAQVAGGERGLCQHWDVTQAYPGTGSHWDCGGDWPADRVLELATGTTPEPAPAAPRRRKALHVSSTLRPGTGQAGVDYIADITVPRRGDRVTCRVLNPNQTGPTQVKVHWGSGLGPVWSGRLGDSGNGEGFDGRAVLDLYDVFTAATDAHVGICSVVSPKAVYLDIDPGD